MAMPLGQGRALWSADTVAPRRRGSQWAVSKGEWQPGVCPGTHWVQRNSDERGVGVSPGTLLRTLFPGTNRQGRFGAQRSEETVLDMNNESIKGANC